MNRIYLSLWLATLILGSACAAEGVPSGHRTALLLGNAGYKEKLAGVTQCLDRVERACKEQSFRVVRRENLDEKALRETVHEFVRSVPTNGIALIYYVGLAAHVERFGKHENLLRPIKASINNDNDYRKLGLSIPNVLKLLREESGARVGLLFLDACWESPIKPQSDKVKNGLIQFDVGEGAMVMLATESGHALPTQEEDKPSRFAESLAAHLTKLDGSVKVACEAISKDAGKAWFAGAPESGIGPASSLPLADSLREGKSPGEGFVNSIGMTFRWCPPGSFQMGSDQTGSPDVRDRKPVRVTLSKGFWMGEHEVTQREYYQVMRKQVPLGFTKSPNAPFWGVSEVKNVEDFCKKLSDLERKAGRLPEGWAYVCSTEAEWEYACRAGSTTAYCFGDSVSELGLYGNFADRTLKEDNPNCNWADERSSDGVGEALAPVGSYRPNKWGLRDFHGNVAELIADHYSPKLAGGKDPLVRLKKDGRSLIRGGAWCSIPLYCELSFRNELAGRDKLNFVGFRVALKKVK